MAVTTVRCAKLKQDLPAIDPGSPEGDQAVKMAMLIGGPEFARRLRAEVSKQAWDMWKDHMLMVMNEYRIDPTSPDSNDQLRPHMEAFFFGEAQAQDIPNYVPPSEQH